MTIPSEPRTPSLYHVRGDAALTPIVAVATAAAAMGSFLLAAGVVANATGGGGLAALAAGELMFLLVPIVVMVRQRRPVAVLGLARCGARELAAAVLLGSSVWYLNMRIVELLPLPEGSLHSLQQLVEAPPLPQAVLVLAVVPAICEEVLFRGVLARGLATRFIPAAAVAISAAMFAAYHLSVVQLLPTFTLGLALGALVLRARSAIPAMVAHLLNNAIALVVARGALPGVTRWIDAHPTVVLAIAVVLAGSGVGLIATRRRLA